MLGDFNDLFQSTLPHGERRGQSGDGLTFLMFQSTLPHGERLYLFTFKYIKLCFNPRSHMGSDVYQDFYRNSQWVSIHAPTWGATEQYNEIHTHTEFQSTLPHGERLYLFTFKYIKLCFNPRSHMGSDSRNLSRRCHTPVSIHAPTWGATNSPYSSTDADLRFNPRSHMGSDFC